MLVLAGLVVVGVFLQVYVIASYIFGAGEDAHTDLGGITHTVELLVVLAAVVAYWKRWAGLLTPFLLALIGTVQLAFTESDDWVGGPHGLLAPVVLILAHAVARRAARDLGLRRHGAAPSGC